MTTIALPLSLNIKTTGIPLERSTAAEAISQGQWLYAASSSTVGVADATTEAKATVVGIAPWDFASGDPVYYVAADDVELDGFVSLTANTKYVLSGTAGQMELLSDLTASEYVSYLGTATTTTKLKTKKEVTGLTA